MDEQEQKLELGQEESKSSQEVCEECLRSAREAGLEEINEECPSVVQVLLCCLHYVTLSLCNVYYRYSIYQYPFIFASFIFVH